MLKDRAKLVILITLTTCLSLLLLDTSILPVALPTIKREIHLSQIMLQWVVNSYLLATAAFVFAGGRMGDIFGHRRVFMSGMFLFAISSAFGAIANSATTLILSRTFQGIGGAMMSPGTIAILNDNFPVGERGKAVGIVVGVSSVFLSIGPFVGGFLTEFFSWRYVFWINVPISLLGIVLAFFFIPKSERSNDSFDFGGFLTLTCALGSAILSIMQGPVWGWSSPVILGLFSSTALFAGLFIYLNRLAKHPFMNFHLLKNRLFFKGNILLFCMQFMMTMPIFWPIYFQVALKMSPLQAGLMMVSATLPVIICAPLSGFISDRMGPKYPILLGFSLMFISFLTFAYFPYHPENGLALFALFAYGTGASLVMTPTGTTTLSSIELRYNGEATGIYNTTRFTGATLGVALVGLVNTAFGHDLFIKSLYRLGLSVDGRQAWRFFSSVDDLNESAAQIPLEQIEAVRQAFIQASSTSFVAVNLLVAGVALFSFLFSFGFFKYHHLTKLETLS